MSEDKDIVIMFAKERNKTIEQQKEIERLKIIEEKYKDSQLYIKDFKDEIERLNNIIKEVKEYIMTNGIHSDYGDKGIDDENKLLAILDKVSDKE